MSPYIQNAVSFVKSQYSKLPELDLSAARAKFAKVNGRKVAYGAAGVAGSLVVIYVAAKLFSGIKSHLKTKAERNARRDELAPKFRNAVKLRVNLTSSEQDRKRKSARKATQVAVRIGLTKSGEPTASPSQFSKKGATPVATLTMPMDGNAKAANIAWIGDNVDSAVKAAILKEFA